MTPFPPTQKQAQNKTSSKTRHPRRRGLGTVLSKLRGGGGPDDANNNHNLRNFWPSTLSNRPV